MVLSLAMALVSCDRSPRHNGSDPTVPKDFSARKIRAVATIGMITEMVGQIGGERVDVQGLMGPGVDPHLYKASEGDVIRIASADVVFYNGLHLEGKMTEVFERMKTRIRTVSVTEGIERGRLLRPPEFEGAYDPHVWFDVTLWMEAAKTVERAFTEMDPGHADTYRSNGKRYRERLEELDRYVRKRSSIVPPSNRVLITAHDAFNYFGRAYGFRVRGLQGISTVAEVGAADIQALARLIVENRIPAVFIESSVPVRYIEALKEAVEARGFRVRIGGSLFSDAMGDPGTPEGNYDGMVRHNIDTIVAALAESGSAGRESIREEGKGDVL
ncbi:MAG: zinc ABC transporter substrate-binding protein [Deltaproteobacteria bacterium]|nr:zinc ABC transporter substrate-binding protein [Deltaproteobacteria bacterium]